MRRETIVKWSGLALILWALHLLVRHFIFAFTHGTTEAAMGLTFAGLDSSQYSVLWTPLGLLGLFGLAGVYVQVSPRLSKLGQAGFVAAFFGLALSFLASVLQFWILDVDAYFDSPLVLAGWLLSLVSVLVLAAGLLLAGIDIRRANALPRGRSLMLSAGIMLVPILLLVGYIVGHSDDSLPWKLLYGGISVPYDLCWLWMGVVLLTATPLIARSME